MSSQSINCDQYPYYYIDKNQKSIGSSCYTIYNKETDAKKRKNYDLTINNNVCSQIKKISPENSYFQDCFFNWKENDYKKNWNASICSASALFLTPYEMVQGTLIYDIGSSVPGVFSQICEDYISSIFTKMSEQQKLAIDVWVAKNIKEPFITPGIMEKIQTYKKLRINEQYQEFSNTDAGKYAEKGKQLKESMDGLKESFKNALPFLVILVVCFVFIGFLVSFRRNISKLSEAGKQKLKSQFQ